MPLLQECIFMSEVRRRGAAEIFEHTFCFLVEAKICQTQNVDPMLPLRLPSPALCMCSLLFSILAYLVLKHDVLAAEDHLEEEQHDHR